MSPQQSRVLIVDDNEMNRDMLARRLSRSGYLVDVAENARQLIQLVKEKRIGFSAPGYRDAGGQRLWMP